MANLATKAGVEGRQQLTIHTPLIQLTKAEIIRRGLELGVDYGAHAQLLRPGRRPGLRQLRLLPAAAAGLRRARADRPGRWPAAG